MCREKYGALKFNYIIMMMKDPFVHYHAFPRYDKNINMFGKEWKDEGMRNTLINFGTIEKSNDDMLFEIRDYMK